MIQIWKLHSHSPVLVRKGRRSMPITRQIDSVLGRRKRRVDVASLKASTNLLLLADEDSLLGIAGHGIRVFWVQPLIVNSQLCKDQDCEMCLCLAWEPIVTIGAVFRQWPCGLCIRSNIILEVALVVHAMLFSLRGPCMHLNGQPTCCNVWAKLCSPTGLRGGWAVGNPLAFEWF